MASDNANDSPPPQKGSLFGEVARDLKLLGPDQIEKALRVQREQKERHGQPRLLGEILRESHDLELRGLHKILLEQQRRRLHQGVPAGMRSYPERIGPFEILDILGTGGMGTVYKAKDPATPRTVALKVLAPRLAEDAQFAARFEREMKTAALLSHPNLVRALGSGVDQGQRYMVMEYVEGQALDQLLKLSGRLPEQRALSIALDVARALEHAHAAGVIHRDVKPQNVLITPAGAKLTDFGLARLLREDQRLTQTGTTVGTANYISPEQVAALRHIDPRTDQYSLGAMLFHMLTGRLPFEGPNNNAVMLKHVEAPLRDPRTLVPTLSEGAVRIVFKLMSKKAAERYANIAQAAEDLEQVLKGQPPRHAPQAPLLQRAGLGCNTLIIFIIAVASAIIWYIK